MSEIELIAIPAGPDYYVECRECGPLGFVPADELNAYTQHHIEDHPT